MQDVPAMDGLKQLIKSRKTGVLDQSVVALLRRARGRGGRTVVIVLPKTSGP
jgi:hypothetical protein